MDTQRREKETEIERDEESERDGESETKKERWREEIKDGRVSSEEN